MKQIISKYLSLNKYSTAVCEDFKENYLSHSNYPSLYAVTDSLKLIGIENITAIVPKNQLVNLPESFIASLSMNQQTEFVLVQQKQDKILYKNVKGKQKIIVAEEFINIWDGLILVIDPNKNKLPKTKLPKQNILFQIGLAVFILLGVFFFLQPFEIVTFLYQLLTVTGLITGVFIIQEELGDPNSIAAKVCNGIDNTISCNLVINSKKEQLPFGVSFSDLPLLFFIVNFLSVSFDHRFSPLVGLISVLSLPIILYSVYLQKYIIKKWCALCLVVSGIIVFQVVLYVFTPKIFSRKTAVIYVLILLVITILWLPLKNTIGQKRALSRENNELKRFKRNFNVFSLLLNKSKITPTNHLQGITIGNIKTPILVEVFLSPSCRFCYRAYKECKDLIEEQSEKIQLKVYFNLNIINSENPYLTVAKSIVQHFQDTQCIDPLNDWYLNKIPFEKWKEKWEKDNITTETENLIQQQFEYCVSNNLNYAPIILVNQKLLPKEYSISELKYFVSELEE